jgi:hypothetical protein
MEPIIDGIQNGAPRLEMSSSPTISYARSALAAK